jgi:hypothetical protein
MSDFLKQTGQKQPSLLPGSLERSVLHTTETEHPHYETAAVSNQSAQRFAQACPLRLPTPGTCPFGGICHSCPARAQAKLKVSQPGDASEQEADQVAEQVMRMPEPCAACGDDEMAQAMPLDAPITPLVQRQSEKEEEEEETVQRQSSPEEEEPVQAKASGGESIQVDTGLESRMQSMRGGGEPLPDSTRHFFEPRFGVDFSQVRVHRDSPAAQAAGQARARAFTIGQDIVMGANESLSATHESRQLMAHELTHVIQQTHRPGMNRQVQRLVRTSRVNCPLPDGTSNNPYGADRRASTLLGNAIAKIDAALAVRGTDPTNADVVTVGEALRRAFRLNPARETTWTQGAPQVRLPVIRSRLQHAKNYIDSVVFQFECVANGGSYTIPGCSSATCDADTEAYSCPVNTTDMILCPLFWTRDRDQQARILMHEVFHIMFNFIEDWDQPDAHNAHCYAQFTALLNGFNSPAGFRCH